MVGTCRYLQFRILKFPLKLVTFLIISLVLVAGFDPHRQCLRGRQCWRHWQLTAAVEKDTVNDMALPHGKTAILFYSFTIPFKNGHGYFFGMVKKWCSMIGNEIGIHFIRIGFNFGAPKTVSDRWKVGCWWVGTTTETAGKPCRVKGWHDMPWHDQEFGALKCV